MNTPKYLEIAELIRIDIFVKYAKENQLIPSVRRYAQIYNVSAKYSCGFSNLLDPSIIVNER